MDKIIWIVVLDGKKSSRNLMAFNTIAKANAWIADNAVKYMLHGSLDVDEVCLSGDN